MSTFTYFPTLPNPSDDPADDVAGMQTNSGSISSILAVDHVGFNVAGGGQHAQVTFNANNVPTPPVSPPVLFTNDDAFSLPQLFFYSGSAAHSSNQYTLTGTNCSTMVLGGIIIKWGSQTFSNTQNPSVTFTNPFPNNLFNIQLSLQNSGYSASSSSVLNVVLTSSTTGFTARVAQTGSCTWYWMAIGN